MNENSIGSFWEHLEELRIVLINIAWIIIAGVLLSFIFHDSIARFLQKPLHISSGGFQTVEFSRKRTLNASDQNLMWQLPFGAEQKSIFNAVLKDPHNQTYMILPEGYIDWETAQQPLLLLSPMEGLSTAFKLSLWTGILGTSPLWLYLIFKFIAPALHRAEKLLVFPFFLLSFIFILLGLAFAYFVTLPCANQYLFNFNDQLGINRWSLALYMDYTTLLLLSNALAFEIFAIILLLVHYGLLKAHQMKSKRRHVIVAAFILGAILTPPDIISQLMLAVPLILLYEMTIIYSYFRNWMGGFYRRETGLSERS